MKRIFVMFSLAIAASTFTANAQQNTDTTATDKSTVVETMPSTGDYYQGYTRPLTFNRMIPAYALEVTFNKTVCAHKGE